MHLDSKQAQYTALARAWLDRNRYHATVAIVGLPGCGKTTLAAELGRRLCLPVLNTDKFRDSPWDMQADLAMLALPEQGVVEGVTVSRMMRRGFHPDCLIHIAGGREPINAGLRTLITNGTVEYTNSLHDLPGRVVLLTKYPNPDAAILSLNNATP